ncbi:hypothetical protein [Streptomyces sp. NBC_01637]|uniref:hypothetical protein n=1 Tax=unclassified Streptomyces TaxID=2593676 RepID=UPI00386EAFD6|nr:hypothetical protein OH719_21805 [Streptomyces sp. NBC_01653]WTD90600.1 hypothetical protein OG891_25075 [Streptomyces sp. NBC_01637]
MITENGPSEDASVIPYGRRRLNSWLVVAPLMIGLIGAPTWTFLAEGNLGVLGWIWVYFSLVMGCVIVTVAFSRWRRRRWAMAFDAVGFWWITDAGDVLMPWDSLEGVGTYRFGKVVTLELCPREELERDHPLLWKFVRDTEPLREGLPRLRYRIDLEANLKPCEEACQQWVPHLWFGRIDQRPGTQGTPDHAGHAERPRARATPAD